MINITQGNDCTLLAAFTRGGEAYTFDSVKKVRLLSAYGRAYALTFSGGAAGLLLALPHTMPAGRYGVEVTGTEGSAERRTMFRDMVEITAATVRAKGGSRAEAGCDDYDIAVSLSLVDGATGPEATETSVARFLTARLDGKLQKGTVYAVCQPQGGACGLETGRQVALFNGTQWLSGLDMAGLRELPVVWEDGFMRAAAEEAKRTWPTVETAADDASSDGEDSSEEDEDAELIATLKAREPYTYGDLMDMDNEGLSIMLYYYGYAYMAAHTGDYESGNYDVFAEVPLTFAVAAVPEVDGLCRGVTAVGEPGFNYWVRLAAIPMAARLKELGESVFSGTAVTEAVLPLCASVGERAFEDCDALATVSLPLCASVGERAFEDCDALATVSLPLCASVGERAFENCDALATVSLPLCASVGEEAFYSCDKWEKIELPEATTIGRYAFAYCEELATVETPKATEVGESAFRSCGKLAAVSLPLAVTIGNEAFYYCTSLASVELPETVTVGSNAFQGCSKLAAIALPKATTCGTLAGLQALETASMPLLTAIGDSFFNNDTSLKTVGLPQCATVGAYAFQSCQKLEALELPVATTIGTYAFSGCSALASVSLPKATSVGSYAFDGCTSLKTLELPEVAEIGQGMFGGYYTRQLALETVSLPKVGTVPNNTFYNMSTLRSVSLPEAKKVGDCAFYGCTSLESLSLPMAEEVCFDAFCNCSALKTLELPCATTIGDYAFSSCYALEKLELPKVTGLSYWALNDSNLAELVLGSTPPDNNGSLRLECVVWVPDDAVETYKASDVWKGYTVKALSERTAA